MVFGFGTYRLLVYYELCIDLWLSRPSGILQCYIMCGSAWTLAFLCGSPGRFVCVLAGQHVDTLATVLSPPGDNCGGSIWTCTIHLSPFPVIFVGQRGLAQFILHPPVINVVGQFGLLQQFVCHPFQCCDSSVHLRVTLDTHTDLGSSSQCLFGTLWCCGSSVHLWLWVNNGHTH
jgi:hypothetical protein